jgi:hypothetical protein
VLSAHATPAFWQSRMGRLAVNTVCRLAAPRVGIGRTYLLLIGAPDSKQFEQIGGPDDRWLQFVRMQLGAAR